MYPNKLNIFKNIPVFHCYSTSDPFKLPTLALHVWIANILIPVVRFQIRVAGTWSVTMGLALRLSSYTGLRAKKSDETARLSQSGQRSDAPSNMGTKGAVDVTTLASPIQADFLPSIITLPTELLLMIASTLPVSAQASSALTCKRLFHTLCSTFVGLRLPREQPSNFREPSMSKPQCYQPERWKFLRLIERDHSKNWCICSDCFMLHPIYMFSDFEESLVPWLKKYYMSKGAESRTCRRALAPSPSAEPQFSLCGVVDLCPCVKLTPSAKRKIEAQIRADPEGKWRRGWWHGCRHAYGEVTLGIQLGQYLYRDCHELGFVVNYWYTGPSDLSAHCPRLLCPHLSVEKVIQVLSKCYEWHSQEEQCTSCQDVQVCKDCYMIVTTFAKISGVTESIDSYYICTERNLDDQNWGEQTIFPFARRHSSTRQHAFLRYNNRTHAHGSTAVVDAGRELRPF